MKRSVERVPGIKTIVFDLQKGQAKLWYRSGASVEPASVWKSVKKAGFTPVEFVSAGKTYRGP